MLKDLEKQVNSDFYTNSVQNIVGKKGEEHQLPNKDSFIMKR